MARFTWLWQTIAVLDQLMNDNILQGGIESIQTPYCSPCIVFAHNRYHRKSKDMQEQVQSEKNKKADWYPKHPRTISNKWNIVVSPLYSLISPYGPIIHEIVPLSHCSPFISYSHSTQLYFQLNPCPIFTGNILVSEYRLVTWSVGQPWSSIAKSHTNIKPNHHYIAIEFHEVPVPIIIPMVHWYYIVVALNYTQLIHDSISSYIINIFPFILFSINS